MVFMARLPPAWAFDGLAGAVNRTEAAILAQLTMTPRSQKEIAEDAGTTQSGASLALKHLVQQKLARRGLGGWMAGDPRARRHLLKELADRRKGIASVERWVKALPKPKGSR
jgi:predicted transcriptional regulator